MRLTRMAKSLPAGGFLWRISNFLQDKKPEHEQVLEALRRAYAEQCLHEDFVVHGYSSVGEGSCTLCGTAQPIDLLIMRWKARIERETGAKINV